MEGCFFKAGCIRLYIDEGGVLLFQYFMHGKEHDSESCGGKGHEAVYGGAFVDFYEGLPILYIHRLAVPCQKAFFQSAESFPVALPLQVLFHEFCRAGMEEGFPVSCEKQGGIGIVFLYCLSFILGCIQPCAGSGREEEALTDESPAAAFQ